METIKGLEKERKRFADASKNNPNNMAIFKAFVETDAKLQILREVLEIINRCSGIRCGLDESREICERIDKEELKDVLYGGKE